MTINDAQTKSYVDELQILYSLKTLVGQYRSDAAKAKVSNIFSSYDKAVDIAASVVNKPRAQIFDEVMRPLKSTIIANLSADLFQKPLTLPTEIAGLADAAKLKSLNDSIAKIQKLKTRLDRPKTVKNADSPLVTMLKAEFAAGIIRNKNLSDAQKQTAMKQLEQAKEIKFSRDGIKCQIAIDGVNETVKSMIAVSGGELGGPSSRYGELDRNAVKELSQVKRSKTFATGLSASAKQHKAQLQNTANLKEEAASLSAEAYTAAAEFVYSLDSAALYQIMAGKNKQGKTLLKTLIPAKQTGALQDNLRAQLMEEVIWDKNVWSLYQENSGRSYYKELPEKIRPSGAVNEVVNHFMTEQQNTVDNRKQAIVKIAGTLLPYEIAQDLFVQSVFSYGMALAYNAKFSMENFARMNNVLQPLGYHINLRKMKAEQECLQGAQRVSKSILEHMHTKGAKTTKNKTIALMYQLGKVLSEDPKRDLSKPLNSSDLAPIYANFSSLFYGAKESGNLASSQFLPQWRNFTQDKENLASAVKIFDHFQKESRSPEQVAKWERNLRLGKYIEEEGAVIKNDGHHNIERKYGGLFANSEELFNKSINITSTISFHPADYDPHREAHKLDTREVYIYQHDDKFKKGAISGIRKDDVVFVPELNVLGKDGKFSPVIAANTLLVTSRGLVVAEPKVPGRIQRTNLLDFSARASFRPAMAR